MRRMLLLAGIAVFAAACATPHEDRITYDRPDLVGPTGFTGPTGPPGAVVIGARGMTGAAGAAGEEGERGLAGLQGSSYAGTTGPAGPRGPAGEQGFAGDTGPQGETLVGPGGRVGRTSSAGVQGERGREGLTGDQGVAGIVARWTAYRDFGFDRSDAGLRGSEMDRIAQIAAYLVQNPSLEVGIDGSLNGRSSRSDRELSDRRAVSVRDALTQAGVPAYQIEMGAFADPDRRHEGQILVLIKTRA